MSFSRSFLLISREFLAISIFSSRSFRNLFLSPLAIYANLGRFIVTTPMEPVKGFEPKSPPPLYSSCLLSILKRQHIERASSGFISEFIKLEKYGIPYLALISHKPLILGLSQSKSLVMLYVGIGNVKTLPSASPSIITSKNALFIISISLWN